MSDPVSVEMLLDKLNEAQRVARVGSWDWDLRTNEVWWSDETYRLFGVRREEYTPGFETNAQFIHPDDLGRYRAAFEQTLATGEPLSLELRLRCVGGAIRSCVARGETILGSDGSSIRVVGTIQDITDRKATEAERDRLIAAVEQAGEFIALTGPDGTVRYANSASELVLGVGPGELVGHNLLQTAFVSNVGESPSAIWASVMAGQRWSGRFRLEHPNGSFRTLDASIAPVSDGTQIADVVAVARDITQETRLEQQLLVSQKLEAIGRLAGGIAHDFNNLLSVILNCSEFVLESLPHDVPAWDDLQCIKSATERAAELTQQLLAFSRRQVLEPVVLDVNQVIAQLSDILRRLLGEAIELKLHTEPNLAPVKADASQLQQVIVNLVVNARDAMQNGGKLSIETANVELSEEGGEIAPGHYVLLAVTDSGCGVDASTKSRMFEPFFSTKEQGKGTGLGLATVYGIVTQSGGKILVYSELGHGTTFKIYLPRCAEQTESQRPSPEPARPLAGDETILLVEDEADVRKVAERILLGAGYHVLVAGDCTQALQIAAAYRSEIHLLLTDVVMPQMSSRELAGRLTNLRPELRVLYMSGYTDVAIVHQGVLDPGIQFISKPFSAASLTRKVRETLARGARARSTAVRDCQNESSLR